MCCIILLYCTKGVSLVAFKLNNLLNTQSAPPVKKRGRSKKSVEVTKPHTTSKQNTKVSTTTNIESTSKSITKADTTITWNRTINKQPDPLRPILFNTKCKKPVTGYKLRNGFITNTPYFINQFKKETGYVEWKYISYCTSLQRCPNGFPNCTICPHSKLQKPTGGK